MSYQKTTHAMPIPPILVFEFLWIYKKFKCPFLQQSRIS